ncbi:MAG: molybdopterin molybdotransferase MoeA [Rhodoglobus sp.]
MTESESAVAVVGWHEARRLAAAVASPPAAEEVHLAESIGLVLAHDMITREAIPYYDSSAMDGWAVIGPEPWVLGKQADTARGSAWPVVTGQILPSGVDGVLRSENGMLDGQLLRTNERATPGEPHQGKHIRVLGTEASAGEVVLRAGSIINPAHVALAASCALDTLWVHPRPRIRMLLTGDEIIPSGVPQSGQVRDSFGPQLPAVISMLGGIVVSSERVSDDLDATVNTITKESENADVIITTGGTGRSEADHIRCALKRMGATLVVPALALRPGGPTMLAILPHGGYVLSLAGNPLAAFMGLLSLGAPLISTLGRRQVPDLTTIELAISLPGTTSATQLVPYQEINNQALPTAWTGSAMTRGLAAADGVLVLPPGGAVAGERVEIIPLPW